MSVFARTIRPLRVEPPGLFRGEPPTPGLTLRPLKRSDRAAFIALVRAARPSVEPAVPLVDLGESDADMFLRHLRWCVLGDRTGLARRRVIELTGPNGEPGPIVGAVNLNNIHPGSAPDADINWWLSPQCRGKGIAAEAVARILREATGELGLRCVHAGIAPDNADSARLARRVGFVLVDGVRSVVRTGAGWERHDVYLYGEGAAPAGTSRYDAPGFAPPRSGSGVAAGGGGEPAPVGLRGSMNRPSRPTRS